MRVRIDITRRDYWKINKYGMLHNPVFSTIFFIIMIGLPIFILLRWLQVSDPSVPIWNAIIAALFFGGVFDIIFCFLMKGLVMILPSGRPGILGEHFIEISEIGLRETTTVNDAFYSWKGVHRIRQNNAYIFIFIDSMMAHVIPKRSFSSSHEADEYFNSAMAYWHKEK